MTGQVTLAVHQPEGEAMQDVSGGKHRHTEEHMQKPLSHFQGLIEIEKQSLPKREKTNRLPHVALLLLFEYYTLLFPDAF